MNIEYIYIYINVTLTWYNVSADIVVHDGVRLIGRHSADYTSDDFYNHFGYHMTSFKIAEEISRNRWGTLTVKGKSSIRGFEYIYMTKKIHAS